MHISYMFTLSLAFSRCFFHTHFAFERHKLNTYVRVSDIRLVHNEQCNTDNYEYCQRKYQIKLHTFITSIFLE